jgi:FKBP-type peptidyl-prolyl cis-trans isomerase
MKPTHTGIAVALALAVIVLVFFPSFLGVLQSAPTAQVSGNVTINQDATTTQPTNTMPTDSTQPIPNSDQLQGMDEVVGTGATASVGDSVTVNYIGSLTNGTVFDASANHGTTGFTFTLGAGQVIKGWDIGVAGMKEGGKRKLIIPAPLAYGSQSPAPSIPANSTLIFEIELLKVTKSAR